jgi:hypothetical protein
LKRPGLNASVAYLKHGDEYKFKNRSLEKKHRMEVLDREDIGYRI